MKTRVLHIIDSFDLGGGQTALLNLISATDRKKYEPEVACMHGHGIFWSRFEELGIPVHSLSSRKWLPTYLARLTALIFKRRPQIVHCHLFGSNWIAKPLATLLGVPVRINHDQCNDGLRHHQPVARWLDTWTNQLSSHVCAVSASTRDFLIKCERLAPENVSLVYNGIDPEKFAPPGPRVRHDRLAVLGVGRLHPQKNFSLFLETAAELSRRGLPFEFRIAGTGPEEKMLRGLADRLGIRDRVTFLGHVSNTQLMYAGADVLLMTSKYEGTPLAILEAMAARLPIVAPRLDGIGEILVDGVDALLVEPPTANGFADAVQRLHAESLLADQLTSAASAKVETQFSSHAMAREVEAIYERCLEVANRARIGGAER